MNPERFKKVEEIYQAVLEISPFERPAFLEKNCGTDLELRQEIESLLSFEEQANSVLDTPPDRLAAEFVAERSSKEIVGRRINQYQVLSAIGEGGMGKVYLARDTRLERNVALKMLADQFAGDSARRNRFFQEAKSASALNHPNILTIHEIGEIDGTHFIVSEFIEGRTLKKYLKEEQPTLTETLDLAGQICSALAAAHEVGLVHRDIKPDNIMIRKDRLVKVLDFGIAKLLTVQGSTELDPEAVTQVNAVTQPGMIIGTPQYMSPEQARAQKIDQRSDIFSFGVLLYETLTGCLPFSGATSIDIIGSILKDEPLAVTELNSELPPELDRLIEKTLRKDREQRYQHIKDLAIDLADIKKTLEPKTQKMNVTESVKARATVEDISKQSPRIFLSWMQILFGLFALLTLIGGIYYWFSTRAGSYQTSFDLKTVEVANWSSSPGEIYSVGSFSPDNTTVAFASTKNGTKNIWVKKIAAGDAVQVTKDDFANDDPIWSPNGEEIAYFSTKGNQPGIWRIPVFGGSASFIGQTTDGSIQLKFWSASGKIYYASKGEVYFIELANGQKNRLTNFAERGITTNQIAVGRDEKTIAFVTIEDNTWNLWTSDLSGNSPEKIFSHSAQIRNPVWHTDGQRLFFSSAVDGTFQIFQTDILRSAPRQITFSDNDNLVSDISADGTRILYGSAKEESDIWAVDLNPAKEHSVSAEIDSELWPDVSPDSQSVAYQSIKNLSQGNKIFNGNIVVRNLVEKDRPSLTIVNAFLPKWSPDGKTLAFLRMRGIQTQIETVPAVGGAEKKLTDDGITTLSFTVLPYAQIQINHYSWSPDSRRLAYVADRNGQRNLWTINADGTNDTQLTENTENLIIQNPIWSPDFKRLAFSTKTNNAEGKPTYTLSVIDPETKKIDPIFSGNSFIRLLGWSANGNALLLASVEKGSTSGSPLDVSFGQVPVETKIFSEITKLPDTYLHNIHLSPDKKTIAFVARREGTDNVLILPSGGGERRQLTDNNNARLYFSSLAWSPDNKTIYFGKQSRYSLLSMLTNFK